MVQRNILRTIVVPVGLVAAVLAVYWGGVEMRSGGGRVPKALGSGTIEARWRAYEGPALDVRSRRPTETTVQGSIAASDGSPLAGAQICAVCAACDPLLEGNEPRCVRADGHGHYGLSALPPGEYYLTAGADGRAPRLLNPGKPVVIDRDGSNVDDVDGELEEGGALLSGVVMDATGGPVAGANVQVNSTHSAGRITSQSAVSAEDGSFSVQVTRGPVRVIGTLDGYAPADVTRYAPASHVRLLMTPPSSVRGRVVTESEGQPVAGAQVRAQGPSGEAATTSDAEGGFVFDALRPGTYSLEAFAPGWIGQYGGTVTVGLLETTSDVVIPVRSAQTVIGRLVAEGGGCELGEVFLGIGRTKPVPPSLAPPRK